MINILRYMDAMSEGAGGPWQEPATMTYLQHCLDQMEVYWPLIEPLSDEWIPEEVKIEWAHFWHMEDDGKYAARWGYADPNGLVMLVRLNCYGPYPDLLNVSTYNKDTWSDDQRDALWHWQYFARAFTAVFNALWAEV